ncbi:MAG: hypothetical protein ABIG61_13330 [Planctomycetota bacterium]
MPNGWEKTKLSDGYTVKPVVGVSVKDKGSLMQHTQLPQADVVRIVKCLGHGCSVEATADICEVDTRTVQRLLENSGKHAADFHRLQLENPEEPLEAVQMDELHGKLVPSAVEGTVKGKHNFPA